MGSVEDGSKGTICSKNGTGSSRRAMRKAPLLVRGRILGRSAVVISGVSNKRRSSEIRSVKASVLPMAMLARAFLIQKISMGGIVERPIKIQPMECLITRRAMPPASRARKRINSKAKIMGRLRDFF